MPPRSKRADLSALVTDSEFINGQGKCAVSDSRMGLMKMSYNGCGAIALYNALRLIGKKPDMGLIVTLIERYGLVLFGILGTSPFSIKRIGKLLGAHMTRMLTYEEFVAAAEGNITILACWTGRPFRSSNHLMAIDGRNGSFLVYNRYNDMTCPSEIPSIDRLCKKEQYVSGYVVNCEE